MRRTLGVFATSVTLVAGLAGAAAGEEPTVVVEPDRTHDVRTKVPWAKEEKARRFIKQSVDIERVTYRVNRDAGTIRVITKVRNVLQAKRRRNQEFLTHVSDRWHYTFAWFRSKERGPVKVWFMDRGGIVKVPCPDARVKLYSGKRKERVVQVVPLSCIDVGTPNVFLWSGAEVLPFDPDKFVSSDRIPEADRVKVG